jgi:hypothetical protein
MVLFSGPIIRKVSVDKGDDELLTLGADDDIVLLHRSTTLAADAELTSVIEGTSDHPGVAANSLIISNITNDGDIMFAVSDGGNSIGLLKLNGADGALEVHGNLLPTADDTYDLGSASAAWQDLFLEGDIALSDATTIAVTASAHDTAGYTLAISAGDTTAGTTNNIAGGALTIQGGQGKGSGAGGDIIFQTANAGSSGSAVNALATALTISDDLSSTFAGAVTVVDDAKLSLGTGSDSQIYYDGTDTFWDLQATGTGALMVGLADSFPSPDGNAVHIWGASAGSVTAHSASGLILEAPSFGYSFITILVPADSASAGYIVGNPTSNAQGALYYKSSADEWSIVTAATARVIISAGAFALQGATTLSTSSSNLTLAAADRFLITLVDDNGNAYKVSNSASAYYTMDTRNTVATVIAHDIDTEDATIASGSGNTYTLARFNEFSLNYTGNTQVTTEQIFINMPSTVVAANGAGGDLTVDRASTLVVIPPREGSNLVLTDAIGLHVKDGGNGVNQMGIYIDSMAGSTTDYAIYMAGTPIIHADLPAASAATNISLDSSDNIQQDTSSIEFKDDVAPLDYDLDRLYDLQPRSFMWNEKSGSEGLKDYGFIAQEAAEVMPEIVNFKDNYGPWSMRWSVLQALMLAEIQRLNERLKILGG